MDGDEAGVARLSAVPPIGVGIPAGAITVSLLLYSTFAERADSSDGTGSWLARLLAAMEGLDDAVAGEARRVLASLADDSMPKRERTWIASIVAGTSRSTTPFGGLTEARALEPVIADTIRLIIRMNTPSTPTDAGSSPTGPPPSPQ